ncbi:MAG: MGMT family protein [Lachnospiraceae bacterium]
MTITQSNNFFEKVYAIVQQIPSGTVTTYGQIARLIGSPRAARQVGYAMRAAPANRGLPCHRVVNRLGELAPTHVFEDKRIQRKLLEDEGITFLPNGKINLPRHFWHGPE